MSVLKSKKTTYSFTPDEIKNLIANDLGKPAHDIKIDYVMTDVSNERFHEAARYEVTSINVTVNESKSVD
jgi:hypothetical protein